jgi:hypothetical protein
MRAPKPITILLVTVVLLLVVAGGLVATWQFARHRQTSPDLQGFWEGVVEVNAMKLRIVLKVENSPEGNYTATMDSIDQGAKGIPINAVTLSNRTVRFELSSMQVGYEGDLNAPATEISGHWEQRGMTLPLILKRTSTPSTIAAPLPSTAYARREDSPLQGTWKGTLKAGGVPLRLVFRISEIAPGKFGGAMDSTDQGARNIPLSGVEFSQPTARFDIASINGQYEGTLKEDASEMDGTWTQVGRNFPLVLKRSDSAEKEAVPSESAYARASDTELQGIWNGTLDVGGPKLRLALRIVRTGDTSYSATMDSVDQGAKDIPATTVTFQDSNVELEWKALRALFHGKLENGKLVGFWQQGPADFPLEFERTNRVTAATGEKRAN